ncbi:MAG: ATP-dependent 6-phosphofructokinase [Alphaproteobacteria bacterium]|nr:ATP-dependent 6-phosphofructokinase [Alphaproteobacteria bacterium]
MMFESFRKYKALIIVIAFFQLGGCSTQQHIDNSTTLSVIDSVNGDKSVFKKSRKRIGILTSGGDCSGLNAIIYAAYKKAKALGYEVIGFKYGVHGVIHNQYIVLDDRICNADILQKSGTLLKSSTKVLTDNNGKLLSKAEADCEIIKRYHEMQLDGLIYIGGNGSIGAIKNILKKDTSLNIVGIPKTIDNDIANTETAVGFATVSEVVCNAIENIISTAQSHERVFVVEVMGRDAGYIALTAGIATGADVILIPEKKYNWENLVKKVEQSYAEKKYAIVIVSESVESEEMKHKSSKLSDALLRKEYGGIAKVIAKNLKKSGLDAKSVNLGHIQRGGKTVVADRLLGQKFGVQAVNLINQQNCGCLLGYQNNQVIGTNMNDIKTTTRNLKVTDEDVILASNLGIYLGE